MTIAVHRATPDDAAEVAHILGDGFLADPVARWVFPDEADQAKRHDPFFRIFADHVLEHGIVYRTEAAAALWLTVDPANPPPDIPEDLWPSALGPNLPRWVTLGGLMDAHHPHGATHTYLALIATLPAHQNAGHGSALLGHHLAATTLPAYLEASSTRSVPLYERHGFARLPVTISLPEGPDMYPMWRPAQG
jgi:ribosomal protein S18 acetylase RimI-like enzyme